MRRILFAYPEVSPVFTNGGIGTFIFEVTNLLASSGQWEVDILTDTSYSLYITQGDFRKAEVAFREAGIRLIDLNREEGVPPGWQSPDVTRAERYQRHIARLHAERHYDIIEFPDWRAPGFFVVRHKRTTKSFGDVLLVVHLHSSTKDVWEWQNGYFLDRNDLYCHYMEEYVKKYSDVVLSPTEFLLRNVLQTQHILEKPLFRNGYPISSNPELTSIWMKGSRGSDVITIACVSRLELRKGQDVLANAIRCLSESKSLDDNVQFVFCGKDNMGLDRDGRMSQSIHRILKGAMNWRIARPKNRRDLAEWLATEVDICVVPSRGDNYPNVVMEAARAGCYLIASDAGGIPEIFKDYNIAGALFSSGDYNALAVEIQKGIKLIRNEPGIRARIAKGFEEIRKQNALNTIATYDKIIEVGQKHYYKSTTEKAKQPRVSIIIPFYNDHQYARDAIKSAFASEYPDFEVILVNDGSDNSKSLEFLKEIETEFPALKIIHKSNGGLGDARNAGLQVASGNFILPLDADNIILPKMLRSCISILSERPNLAYVTTYFECMKDEDLTRSPWQMSPAPRPFGAVDGLILLEPTPGDALAMIRKSALDLVGGYTTTTYCMEDWDLWLKFHERGMEGDVLPEVHFIYRLRNDSMSHSLNALAGIRLHQALLRRHSGLLKEQALAISTLLIHEYWHQWRGPDVAWNLLVDMLRRAMANPALALKYVTRKISYSLKEWVRNKVLPTHS
ncbi:MAG TPA: glycosyltransferase [Thermodesulfobacteriota bacterium]|nr:glycosyltransferase [Thermodesulfobacteriota bacterium]